MQRYNPNDSKSHQLLMALAKLTSIAFHDQGAYFNFGDNYYAYTPFIDAYYALAATQLHRHHFNNSVYLHSYNLEFLFGYGSFKNLLSNEAIEKWQSALSDFISKKKKVNLAPIKKLPLLDQLRILLLGPEHYLAIAAKNVDLGRRLEELFDCFDKSIIACALEKPLDNMTPLELAAIHQSSDVFQKLFFPIVDFNSACEKSRAQKTPSVIHYAAKYQSPECFQQILLKISSAMLNDIILVKDDTGLYLFEIILLNQSNEIAKNYISLSYGRGVSSALKMYNECIDAMVHLLVTDTSSYDSIGSYYTYVKYAIDEDLLEKCVNKFKERKQANPDLVGRLLHIRPKSQTNIDAQQWLVENRSLLSAPSVSDSKEDATNVITGKKRELSLLNNETFEALWAEGFDSAADFRKASHFYRNAKQSIIVKYLNFLAGSKKLHTGCDLSLAKLITFNEDQKVHRLHIAITKYSSSEITALIELLPQSQLDLDIVKQDPNGASAIKIAAKRLDETTFLLLCNKVSKETLKNAIKLVNKQNENAFHDIAVYQSNANFKAITQLLTSYYSEIETALIQKNDGQTTPMHLAAYYLNDAITTGLRSSFLRSSMKILDANKNTPLFIFISKQSADLVRTMLNFLTADNSYYSASRSEYLTLNSTANNDDRYLIEQAFIHQTPEIVLHMLKILMLDKENDYTGQITWGAPYSPHLEQVLKLILKKENIRLRFLNMLCTQNDFHNNNTLTNTIARILNDALLNEFAQLYYYGIKIPTVIQTSIKSWLDNSNYQKTFSFTFNSSIQLLLSEIYYPVIETNKNARVTMIRTSKKTPLFLTNPQFLSILYREGVMSYHEYRELRKFETFLPGLRSALNRLIGANRLYSGSLYEWAPETTAKTSLGAIESEIDDGEVYLQLVPEATWPTLLRQLNRQEEQKEEKNVTHRYVHTKDVVIPYEPADEKEAQKFPVKNARLIALANGRATTIGDKDEKMAPRVGLFYDRYECTTQAMFTTEMDTSKQEWLGTKEQVEAYAKRIKPISYTSRVQFANAVKNHPYKVNLVLADLAPEAALAICIVDDTLAARLYACNMAADFAATFHRELPIVCFNPNYCALWMHLPEVQAADQLENATGKKVNPYAENEAKARLLALRDDINQHKQWGNKGVLLFKKAVETAPDSAKSIVALIDQTEKSGHPFWEKTAKAVTQQLKENSGNKNEVEQFFEIERKKYFK